MKHAALAPFLTGLALMSLAACQKAAPPPPEERQRGGAQGEVLEGTISDDMLPLDIVIQPELRPAAAVDGDAASGGAGEGPAPDENAGPVGDPTGEAAASDQSSDG